jgi:gliding motility-associated-like protein
MFVKLALTPLHCIMKRLYFIAIGAQFIHVLAQAQIITTNAANLSISTGAVFFVNGGMNVSNSTTLSNNGALTITKNSTLPIAGTFNMENSSTVSGNGLYSVEQDWVNSATFNAGTSKVSLFGNTQQFITSNNGTITTFNDLELLGTGTGVNRKKTLQTVDAKTGSNGNLQINDRELETQSQTFSVLNTAVSAVSNNTTPGSEGFVSSVTPGVFSRKTNASAVYVFPTGSSAGTLRYRPVELTPADANANTYVARLNNVDASTQSFDRTLTDGKPCDLNALYFHSINRVAGTSSTDVRLFYITASDGSWSGMSQWQTGNVLWNDMNALGAGASGTFATRTRSGWNFVKPGDPYILSNIRPEPPVLNCPALCENSTNNMFTLTGTGTSYQWTFPANGTITGGQGTSSVTASWTTGASSVSAIAIGPNGCNSLPGICTPVVVPPPTVNFDHADDMNTIDFTDHTSGSADWSWSFGDSATSTSQNPSHTYSESGTYTVTLYVTDATGCSNSATQVVEILGDIVIPNVFSPNGDGINDLFTIKSSGLKTYDLVILNRWGNKVFTSTSPKDHWDGKDNGKPVPDGVYFYILNASASNKEFKFHGDVTVFN